MSFRGERLRVAILGSGNIGTDLLLKTRRSEWLECTLFVGRNLDSKGMQVASKLGVPVSDRSIDALIDAPDVCDLVFDATSAHDHLKHWPILQQFGKVVIDVTPAKIGGICVPAINLDNALEHRNINMVSCGGQASIPLTYLIGLTHDEVDYIEIVSSIASLSAGPATRANIDQYIETTEEAVMLFSKCRRAKVILNLNPSEPCIDMQTTIFAEVRHPNLNALRSEVDRMVTAIQRYVPGYELLMPPRLNDGRLTIMVKVQGRGDYLPRFAGNLDIINCAAINVAEMYARRNISVRAHAIDSCQ